MFATSKRRAALISAPLVLIALQLGFVTATEPAAYQEEPGCPGEQMGVQATGVYNSQVVESVVINGEPWGGADCAAGHRSYWHCHGGGQFILVMEGEGRAQKRGERMRELRVGEIEFALPGVEHWHGASPSSRARHINQSMSVDGGSGVFWMEEVSEADYSGNAIGIQSRNRFLETGER